MENSQFTSYSSQENWGSWSEKAMEEMNLMLLVYLNWPFPIPLTPTYPEYLSFNCQTWLREAYYRKIKTKQTNTQNQSAGFSLEFHLGTLTLDHITPEQIAKPDNVFVLKELEGLKKGSVINCYRGICSQIVKMGLSLIYFTPDLTSSLI